MFFYKTYGKIKPYLNRNIALMTIIASLVSYFIIYLFYDSKLLGVIITIGLIPLFIININKYFKDKLKRKINKQFLELLQALQIGMESGQTFSESLIFSHKLLQNTLGNQSLMVKEMTLILSKLNNNIMLDKALIEFANRMDTENITSFCKVYKLASKNSDDLSSILKKNINLLSDVHKQDMEIDTILIEKKIEIILLSLFPVILMMFFRLFYPTYCNLLYGNFIGRVTMTIAITIFILAIVIAKNIFKKTYDY